LSVIVDACVMPAVSPVITQTIAIMFLIFMFIGVGGYLVGWWVGGCLLVVGISFSQVL
jgi:hypothetical protein